MASRTLHKPLSTPLIQHLFPARGSLVRQLLHVAFGVALIGLLAQVRLSIGPVPLTGQTLAVLLIATTYGATLGSITIVSYLIAGGLGLTVFSGGSSGWAILQGSTAGYLFGFLVATTVVGFLAQRGWDKKISTMVLAMLIGNLIIYTLGLIWLSRFAPDWTTTLAWGLTPFVIGDLIKIVLVAVLLPALWSVIGKKSTSP